jgi:hypothetical protein
MLMALKRMTICFSGPGLDNVLAHVERRIELRLLRQIADLDAFERPRPRR